MNASEKSAIVMLTLGDVPAAEVFKHLNAHEVKQISASMVNMAGFTHDQMAMVLEEFKKTPANMRRSASTPTIICAACWSRRWAKSVPPRCWRICWIPTGAPTASKRSTLWIRRRCSTLSAKSTRRSSPPFWSTSNVTGRRTCWANSTSANVTTSCCVSPPSAAYSRPRCRS